MNILNKCLISIFLIALLMNTACGYGSYALNTTPNTQNMTMPQTTLIEKPQDLKNATESDQDIIIRQHLLEYDAVQLQSENKLFIRETLIFWNNGTKDFYGFLKTWLPEGSEKIVVSKSEMMTGGGLTPLEFNKTGNILSWKDYVEKNSTLPLIYAVEYIVTMKLGASSTGTYLKKIVDPTSLNYRYIEKPGLPALVVKITKPQESSIKIFDEKGNELNPTTADETGEIIRFSSPQFKELNIELSKSTAIPAAEKKDNTMVYVIIGILILLVLLYPYISKKLKKDESGKTSKSDNSGRSQEKLKGNNNTEMDPLRKELGLKLKELEAKYKSGELLDEEYEDEKNAIQNKLKSISKRSK